MIYDDVPKEVLGGGKTAACSKCGEPVVLSPNHSDAEVEKIEKDFVCWDCQHPENQLPTAAGSA